MAPERRLDRLESIVKLMIKAGRRERRESREKVNALIDAQMRTEQVLARFARRTEEEMAHLARAQANTEESLKALIETVDRIAGGRGNGNV